MFSHARIIILIFFLFLVMSCASTGSRFTKAADPPHGKGTLYVYRSIPLPLFLSPTINIDDKPISKLKYKTYIVAYLEAGIHEIHVEWTGLAVGVPELIFDIDILDGKNLYLEIYGSGIEQHAKEVSEELALKELLDYSPMK